MIRGMDTINVSIDVHVTNPGSAEVSRRLSVPADATHANVFVEWNGQGQSVVEDDVLLIGAMRAGVDINGMLRVPVRDGWVRTRCIDSHAGSVLRIATVSASSATDPAPIPR